MIVNDPIGDMLTRIRNGQRAGKSAVKSPNSKARRAVLDVLQKEGYIRGYSIEQVRAGIENINIELKYHDGLPVIEIIQRVSKPGLRVYSPSKDLGSFMSGLGIYIVSTPKGVMTDVEAKEQGIGGEVLCKVY
ncbi:MAG: 30S ribosomal protein S8 [Candidatus Paracaedibacteraceae bacterium]|nr:30S ribosomal protein S8 [Candidatus Paracaedibacteraceae bacterium]